MLVVKKEHVVDSMSPANPPCAKCQSGDTVLFETKDCYDDRLMADGTVVGVDSAYANPATGPLFVEGAEKGDVLKVEIIKIQMAPTALMRVSLSDGAFQHNLKERQVRQYDTTGDSFKFNQHLTLKMRPMVGVIGTAPESGAIPTTTPGKHGSNMDCKEIVEGSTLYLPVNTPGGLLAMGDIHGLMGDGEVMICGLEAAGEVTVRVSVVKGFELPTPCLRQGGRFMTIQSAETLDEASILASREMQAFLINHTPMDEYDSARLLSLTGDLAVCQIVDPLLTVRMMIDESILSQCGVKLP